MAKKKISKKIYILGFVSFFTDLSSVENRGSALGLFATTVGIGLLPASIVAGILYAINPAFPFILGSILSFISCIIILCCK